MGNAIQKGIFENAGIKKKNPSYLDLYDNQEDFNLDSAPSSGELRAGFNEKIFGTSDAPSSSSSPNFFDFDVNLKDIDLGGISSLAKGIGGIWDAYNKKQYQDEIVGMEKERVNREVAKQAKAQSALEAAWA